MKPIPTNTPVRQIVPVIIGIVARARLNEEQGELEYLVAYEDDAGHPAERWFLASQIAVTEGATTEQVPA